MVSINIADCEKVVKGKRDSWYLRETFEVLCLVNGVRHREAFGASRHRCTGFERPPETPEPLAIVTKRVTVAKKMASRFGLAIS